MDASHKNSAEKATSAAPTDTDRAVDGESGTTDRRTATRKRPAFLRALGRHEPPQQIFFDNQPYDLIEIFKHDSWAATAAYASRKASGLKIVCKFNRVQPIGLLPMAWLGRRLARREAAALVALDQVNGIPSAITSISDGYRVMENAVAHEFIEGHPLQREESLQDEFFVELKQILQEMHHLGFAYVDLHKRENILVDTLGKPHLIDFQISFCARGRSWARAPLQWTLRILQASDLFCLSKHVRIHRPEQLAMLGLDAFAQPPWWIRLHRLIAVPFRQARRRLLTWIGVRDRSGRSRSEEFAEHAMRCEANRS